MATDVDQRSRAFKDALTRLVVEYRDVPCGARGMTLFTATAALIAAEAGHVPTASEFGAALLGMIGRLVKLGMIRPDARKAG